MVYAREKKVDKDALCAVLSHVCKKVRLHLHLLFDIRRTHLQMNEAYAYIPSVTYISNKPQAYICQSFFYAPNVANLRFWKI